MAPHGEKMVVLGDAEESDPNEKLVGLHSVSPACLHPNLLQRLLVSLLDCCFEIVSTLGTRNHLFVC